MNRCPYCGAVFNLEETSEEFSDFEDCGDYIIATGDFHCQCGKILTIRTNFFWDEKFQIL